MSPISILPVSLVISSPDCVTGAGVKVAAGGAVARQAVDDLREFPG